IAIGTAFIAATLLATGVMTRTTYDAVSASYADADLVVAGDATTDDDLAAVSALSQVAAAEGVSDSWLQLSAGARVAHLPATTVPDTPRLQPQRFVEGEPPGAGGIALPAPTAER